MSSLPRIPITVISSFRISTLPLAIKCRPVRMSPRWTSVSPGGAWVVRNLTKLLELPYNHPTSYWAPSYSLDYSQRRLDNCWGGFDWDEDKCRLVNSRGILSEPGSCRFHWYRTRRVESTPPVVAAKDEGSGGNGWTLSVSTFPCDSEQSHCRAAGWWPRHFQRLTRTSRLKMSFVYWLGKILTSNNHHDDGKNLLAVRRRWHVSKS